MANLASLNAQMEAISASLKQEASRCAIETAQKIHQRLVEVTPVDTTNAVSNWDLTLFFPMLSEHEPYYPGFKGSTAVSSRGAALREGLNELSAKKPGDPIFISNNVDYINDLNAGKSQQVPPGFIESAILVGKVYARSFKVRI